MKTAVQKGWIQEDGKNSYPDRNITREEITKILVSAYEQKYGEISASESSEFTDSEQISSWAEIFVNKAVSAGLINGMGDGKFCPAENAKREQAMVLIYRLLNTKTEWKMTLDSSQGSFFHRIGNCVNLRRRKLCLHWLKVRHGWSGTLLFYFTALIGTTFSEFLLGICLLKILFPDIRNAALRYSILAWVSFFL